MVNSGNEKRLADGGEGSGRIQSCSDEAAVFDRSDGLYLSCSGIEAKGSVKEAILSANNLVHSKSIQTGGIGSRTCELLVEEGLQSLLCLGRCEAVILGIHVRCSRLRNRGTIHTIVSDWMIADLNKEEAEGTASNDLIKDAPALCPARVICVASPPKLGTTFCKNFKAFIASLIAKLVCPLGGKNPSCKRRSIS